MPAPLPQPILTAPPPGEARRDLNTAIVIVLLALILRLVWLHQSWACPLASNLVVDADAYWQWSNRIAAGDWAGGVGDKVFYQAPLYPYVLAVQKVVLGPIFGKGLADIKAEQMVLGAMACGFLFMGLRLWMGRAAALAGGLMLAVYPPAMFYDALIQKANLSVVWMTLLLWFMGRWAIRPGWWRGLLVGVVMALLMLTREETILLVPLLAVWMLWSVWSSGWKVRFLRVGALAVGMGLMLGPVVVRNWVVGHELALTTSQAGSNFYIGNHAGANGTYQPLRPGRANVVYEQQDAFEVAEQAAGRKLSPNEVSRYWFGQSWAFIKEHPGDWAGQLGHKSGLLVNWYEVPDAEDQYFYEQYSPVLHAVSRVFHFGIIVPLAGVGFVAAWPRRRALWPLVALAAVLAGSVVLFYVFGRYRYPFVLALWPFAALGVVELIRVVRGRMWKRIGLLALVIVPLAVAANRPIFRRDQNFAIAYHNAGSSLAIQGKLAEALPLFQQAIAADPNFPDAYFNLGFTYWNMGRKPEAHEPFLRAVQLNSNDARSRYMLGLSFMQQHDLPAAAEHLRRAVALAPQDLDSRGALVDVLTQLGLWREAVPYLKAIVREKPEDYQVKLGLAWTLATSSDPQVRDGQAAVVFITELMAATGRQPVLLNALSAAYAETGDFDKAIAAVDEAIAGLPTAQNQPPGLLEFMRKSRLQYQQHQPIRSP